MYENIYAAYYVGLKPPSLSAHEVKPALKELKGYQVQKHERKEAVRYSLHYDHRGAK